MNNSMRDDMNEQQLADQTVDLLESHAMPAGHDEVATQELGQLLRQSADHDLPQSSDALREMLLGRAPSGSADGLPVGEGKEDLQYKPGSQASASDGADTLGNRNRWLALATLAASALCAFGLWLYSDNFAGDSVASHSDPNDSAAVSQEASVPPVAKPKVLYRMETRTRTVPPTKTRTETRTRTYEVQKSRLETREIKLADGTIEKKKVSVPYTEQVQQNYTVQVPYTENVTQTYAVPVPYTADGKRIEAADYDKYGVDLSRVAPAQNAQQGDQNQSAGAVVAAVLPPSVQQPQPYGDLDAVSNSVSSAGQSGLAASGSEPANNAKGPTKFMSGGEVTVELPKLAQTDANTIVDAPDDGTVVTGGIKRMRESARPNDLAGKSDGQQVADSFDSLKKEIADVKKQRAEKSTDLALLPGTDGEKRKLLEGKEPSVRYARKKAIIADGNRPTEKFFDGNGNGINENGQTASEWGLEKLQEERELLPRKNEEIAELEYKSQILSERQSGEQYAPIHENSFVKTVGLAAVSTFSIDVDSASYSNMRRFLNNGQRPPANSIRIEELVNYFSYDYPQPKGEDPFSVNMEVARCPWNESHQLLRVGLKGKEIDRNERPATNVVYLLDVSGSMQNQNKLPLLKSGFQMLTKQLNENDRVSIVTYAGNAGVALEPTCGEETKKIVDAIQSLSAGGSTHGSAGIELAYKLAQQNFIKDGVNKVILATDGDLNVGVTDDDALVKLIKQKASEGVFLTVLGFGTGNIKDAKLEQIADNGNGHYAYIDNTREAHRVLVEQMSGSLVTIAKDVKLQIEFNPAEVKSYRLIGYENRVMAAADFANDRKDAGEIGAGHTVTAIYEIEPAKVIASTLSIPKGLKYQSPTAEEAPAKEEARGARISQAAGSGELATLALRYKLPDANKSKLIEFAVENEDRSFTSASDDFRFAASVAGFGMWLRGSQHAGDAHPMMLLEMATEAIGDDKSGYRSEFVDLIRKACR